MKRFLNAAFFQIIWFVCLLAGSAWALAATALYLFLHDRYFMTTRREWRLLFVFVALGLLVDGTLFQLGVFSNGDGNGVIAIPPVWLLCLWVSTGTLFVHSLAFLRSRYLLSSALGMIGPTMSYFAGARLAGITLAEPIFMSLLVVALVWAIVLPLGFWLSEKWDLFEDQDLDIRGIE